jgi:xanthine dehydrogenase iron-sulfur cluster and FAD-binding subunit A
MRHVLYWNGGHSHRLPARPASRQSLGNQSRADRNICRCTGYERIVDAAIAVSQDSRGLEVAQ